MNALIPYIEPPIPRVVLEIERLRQRLDDAEEALREQGRIPAGGQIGVTAGRFLGGVTAAGAAALVVIAGSLIWQQTRLVSSIERTTPAQASFTMVQAPNSIAQPTSPPAQTPRSLDQMAPDRTQIAEPSVQTPPAPATNTRSPRQSASARSQIAHSSRQSPAPRTQSTQLSRQKPAAPVQTAQSAERTSIPALYRRPPAAFPPPMTYGYGYGYGYRW